MKPINWRAVLWGVALWAVALLVFLLFLQAAVAVTGSHPVTGLAGAAFCLVCLAVVMAHFQRAVTNDKP